MQLTLDGSDKLDQSIERLKAFEPAEGYLLKFSGGKDSVVLLDVARRAGVRFEAVYNMEIDPPEHVRWMRETFTDSITFRSPTVTMWSLIERNGYPPTRKTRYCCRHFKEHTDPGRVVLTGVRWDESARRSRRRMTEACTQSTGTLVHPIIDWTDAEVWEHINANGLATSPIYAEGMRRVGCVMCPLANVKQQQREALRWPKIADAYRRSCQRAIEYRRQRGLSVVWDSGDEMYEVWLGLRQAPHREAEPEATRYCMCGCGSELPGRAGGRQRKYVNDTHRMRHVRAR